MRSLVIVLVTIFGAALPFSFSPCLAWARPLHVIVDPGHGGSDNGATNEGLKESDIVLKVSRNLAALLKKDSRFKVTLTRTTNETVSLVERTELAKSVKGDIFLSIHVNSNTSTKARGPEIYFQNQMAPDEESRFLASRENSHEEASGQVSKSDGGGNNEVNNDVNNIIADLRRSFHTHQSFGLVTNIRNSWFKTGVKPGIRQGPFHVLYEVPMPSALVELGFISNAKESQWLAQPETHRALAEILYEGLVSFKERMDKKRPKS